jgi:hypothetical protein
MLNLPNEVMETICQQCSPADLLSLRAVHRRLTAIATREIPLKCHIDVEGRTIMVEAELEGKGRVNIGKGAKSDAKKCWIPQIREIIVHSSETSICLQAVSRVQQMRTLQPGVRLRFEQELLANELPRLVRRIQELPPFCFKVHLSLLDDGYLPHINAFADKWFAQINVRNCPMFGSGHTPHVTAYGDCEVNIILADITFQDSPFPCLASRRGGHGRRTLEMHGVEIYSKFDGPSRHVHADFDALVFSNLVIDDEHGFRNLVIDSSVRELATFSATETGHCEHSF